MECQYANHYKRHTNWTFSREGKGRKIKRRKTPKQIRESENREKRRPAIIFLPLPPAKISGPLGQDGAKLRGAQWGLWPARPITNVAPKL